MSTTINDGTGTGDKLKINEQNRLEADSVTFDREDDAVSLGNGYQITSTPVTFSAGGTLSGVLYFKNREDTDVVVDRIVLMIGTGDLVGDWSYRLVRNPTGGTLLDNAVAAGISNSNHGSANILNAGQDIYRGVEGDTVTGGAGAPLPVHQTSNRIVFPVGRRIPKGGSFAVMLGAPTINSGTCTGIVVAHVYIDTKQLER